ncbi:MAG: IS1 family transposase [Cyanobacteriota bacterium]
MKATHRCFRLVGYFCRAALEPVLCPACGSDDVVKHGRSDENKQRYKCRNGMCGRSTFIRDYAYRGYLPEVKQQISVNAASSLHLSIAAP